MTGQQAIQVLQKPVFGDEKCIEARDTLLIIDEIQEETGAPLEELMEEEISIENYRYLLEEGAL